MEANVLNDEPGTPVPPRTVQSSARTRKTLAVLLAAILIVAVFGVVILLSNQSSNLKLPSTVTVSGSVSIRAETITAASYTSTATFSPSLVVFICDESTGCNSTSIINVSGSVVNGAYSVTLPNGHDYSVSVTDTIGEYYVCGTVNVSSQSPSLSYDVSC